MSDQHSIIEHYGTIEMIDRVEEAFRLAGHGDGVIPWEALAPLDQFHFRGYAATSELGKRLSVKPGDHVLDVGCGLGGPARHLASVYECFVTGIDLSQPFIGLATMLSRRTGLSDRVRHLCADALQLPFGAASFDLAVTQHVSMNIADKSRFYAGIHRVLRPGGLLAIYDIVSGEGGSLHFPVPWARHPENSFLTDHKAMKTAIETAGFVVRDWIDQTEVAVAWWEAQAARRVSGAVPAGLALPLIMGPEFPVMAANLGRNLVERRARLIQAIVERPA
ncbi:class I SAM-dependent methyltransferase [Propionivibrio sp.]|uniref:class I SAM-dependent methyltransferase n=1 Tax=Propionivibrio sp. TaxID=2212460 RepID=UPI003BF3C6CC